MYFNNDVWCPNTIPIHNLERAFHFTNFFYNQVRWMSYCACIGIMGPQIWPSLKVTWGYHYDTTHHH